MRNIFNFEKPPISGNAFISQKASTHEFDFPARWFPVTKKQNHFMLWENKWNNN